MKGINVTSEIGKLRKVLLHRPGEELLNLTPDSLEDLLFDDIPFLPDAQKEHDAFAQALRDNGVEVVYLEDLMAEVISQNNGVRANFIKQFMEEAGINIGDVGIGQNQLQLATNHGNNTPDVRFEANRWYHVAVVYEYATRNVSYYVNGALVATGSGFATQSVNLTNNCFVGKSYDNSRSFCGDIAEMRVWKTARSRADIAASMYEFRGSSADLVAYWKFNEGAGNVVKDQSGNGNDITANAALTWKEIEGGINVE